MDSDFMNDFKEISLKHFYDDLFDISQIELRNIYYRLINEFSFSDFNWEVHYDLSIRLQESSGIKMF